MGPTTQNTISITQNPLSAKNQSRSKSSRLRIASRDVALRHALQAHPHKISTTGNAEPLKICLRTGRFVPTCCKKFGVVCDCCCEGKEGDLTEFGAGISGWFKLLKLLIGSFSLLVVLALVPIIVVGVPASLRSISPSIMSELARLTIGNVNGPVQLPQLVCGLFEHAGLVQKHDNCTLTPGPAASILVQFECISILVLLGTFLWMVRSLRAEGRSVGAMHLGADAFTVYFPWAPPADDPAAPELQAHIEKCLKAYDGYEHAIREISLIQDSFSLMSIFSKLSKVRKRIDRGKAKLLKMKWARGDSWKMGSLAEYEVQAAEKGVDFRKDPDYIVGKAPLTKCCGLVKLDSTKRIHQSLKKVETLQKELDHLQARATAASRSSRTGEALPVKGAFVTFECLASKEAALHVFAPSFLCGFCRPRHLRYEYTQSGKPTYRILHAKPAPPPDVVNWPSFTYPRKSVVFRRMCTSLASLAVVVLSSVLTIAASTFQEQLQPASEACGSSVAPRALQTLPQQDTSSTWPHMRRRVAGSVTDAICGNCSAVAWTALSVTELKRAPERIECTQQFCTALLAADISSVQNEKQCSDWLTTYITMNALIVAASVVSVIVNFGIITTMDNLIALEVHKSVNSENQSYSKRLFFMQFINMVAVPIFVNAAIGLPDALALLEGESFRDTTPRWFAVVGAGLVLTIMINSVTQHVKLLLKGIRLQWRRRSEAAPSQGDMNKLFTGPKWKSAKRLAQLMSTIGVCLIFAPAIPILTAVGLVAVVMFYWVEVVAFVKILRTPPKYSTDVLQLASYLFLIIFMRVCFGLWTLGSPSLFDQDAARGESILRESTLDRNNGNMSICDWSLDTVQSRQIAVELGEEVAFVTPTDLFAGLVVRMCNPHLQPLWLLFVLILSSSASLFLMNWLEATLALACRVLTFGKCCARYEPTRQHKEHLYASTFDELACPGRGGQPAILKGLLTYNMLHHPRFREQFGYSDSFLAGLDANGKPLVEPGWRPTSLADLSLYSADTGGSNKAAIEQMRAARSASMAKRVVSGSVRFGAALAKIADSDGDDDDEEGKKSAKPVARQKPPKLGQLETKSQPAGGESAVEMVGMSNPMRRVGKPKV